MYNPKTSTLCRSPLLEPIPVYTCVYAYNPSDMCDMCVQVICVSMSYLCIYVCILITPTYQHRAVHLYLNLFRCIHVCIHIIH